MKIIELYQLLQDLEEAERPHLGRTKVSRNSDKLIDDMEKELAPFIAAYMAQGFFTASQMEELRQLFRQFTQDQYLLGQDYTDKKTGDRQPLTQQDLDNINRLADDSRQDFMDGLAKKKKDATQKQVDPTAIGAAVGAVAAATLGVKALNTGTVSHARLVEFVTRRDNKVCPICEPLDGNIYEIDPLTKIIKNGPAIPDDTHPNCRCRYLVVGG